MRVLIVIRRGGTSIHGAWVNQVRNLADIGISTYADTAEEPATVLHHHHKGTKQEALHDLFTQRPDLLDYYDYVWCVEDDLHIPYESAYGILNALSNTPLSLCAPSLTYYSYYSWACTISNDNLSFRGVDFIETMAPIFSSGLLREVLPSFVEFPIYGSCVTWKQAMHRRGEISIQFDEFPIVHTRPVGGGELYRLAVRNPHQDLADAYRLYNSEFGTYGTSWFGQTRDNRVLTGTRLYHAMFDGYRRFFDYHPGAEQAFEEARGAFNQYDNRFVERLNFNVSEDVLRNYNRINGFPDFRSVVEVPWVLGSQQHGDYRELRLRRDGRVEPEADPNETTWRTRNGNICLLDQHGRISVEFSVQDDGPDGTRILRGTSRPYAGLNLYLRSTR